MDSFARALAGLGANQEGILRTAVVTGVPVSRDAVTINLYGKTATIRKPRGYVPSVGDVILVLSEGDKVIAVDSLGPHSASAAPGGSTTPSVTPPDGTPGAAQTGIAQLPAARSSSWRPQGGWMTWDGSGDLYQGTGYGYGPHKGLWFYDGGPQSALAGLTITEMLLRLVRRTDGGSGGASTVHIYPHAYPSRPGAEPALGAECASVSLARGQAAEVSIPLAVAQGLTTGAVAGFAIASDPYVVLAGVGRDSSSGFIRAAWRR